MAHPGKPLSWALREEICKRAWQGDSYRQIARSLGVAVNTVRRYAGQPYRVYEHTGYQTPQNGPESPLRGVVDTRDAGRV